MTEETRNNEEEEPVVERQLFDPVTDATLLQIALAVAWQIGNAIVGFFTFKGMSYLWDKWKRRKRSDEDDGETEELTE